MKFDYIVDIAFEMLSGVFGSGSSIKYGVYESNTPSTTTKPDPQNMSTVFMVARILSYTISSMPLEVVRERKSYKKHPLYYDLRYRLSEVTNNQAIFSTLEYHRNIFGNAFFHHKKKIIIPPECVDDYDFNGKNGGVRYHVNWSRSAQWIKKHNEVYKEEEWIDGKEVWHFKGLSVDGVMGLPPVSAAIHNMTIMNNATGTIINFYQNRAMSPMVVESKIDTAAGAKATISGMEKFTEKYVGVPNVGKPIIAPPNTKLTPLQIHFADAELINTMKFTRDEICNMYGIPSFLYNSSDSVQLDIEQQSLAFRTFTLAPIAKIYAEEIAFKSLTKDEILDDIFINFDTSVMIETDLVSKANAYAKMIQSGLMSPNQAALKIGTDPVESEAGDWKFVQQQLIALQQYERMHPLFNQENNNKPIDKGKNEEIDEPKKD